MQPRKLPAPNQVSKGERQVLSAITWFKKPFDFTIDDLTEEKLIAKIAKLTNSARFHFTPNCPLLALALFYNLKMGSMELSGKNSFPYYKPVNTVNANRILFGNLNFYQTNKGLNISQLQTELLNIHKLSGERSFVIIVDFQRTFLSYPFGHVFNAVILGKENDARVVFVDAWTTRHRLYTPHELEKRYFSKRFKFHGYYHIGSMQPIERPTLKKC